MTNNETMIKQLREWAKTLRNSGWPSGLGIADDMEDVATDMESDLNWNPGHTPGPWKWQADHLIGGEELADLTIEAPGCGTVATINLENIDRENDKQALADARLIAAAPSLLKAAFRLLSYVSKLDGLAYDDDGEFIPPYRALSAACDLAFDPDEE